MKHSTLVLLSGLDGTGLLFKPLLEILPSYLKPLVIPYQSDKFLNYDELVHYVRERIPNDEPFILLAESFSGAVAVKLAASHPTNLQALILCASFVTNPAPRVISQLRFIFNSQFFKLRPPQSVVRRFLLGRDAPSDLVSTFFHVLQSVSPEVLSSRLQSVLDVDVRDALSKCQVPILYLAAKQGKLVGRKNRTEIKALAPDVDVVEIDAPHFLLQREPQRAAEAINNFLKSRQVI